MADDTFEDAQKVYVTFEEHQEFVSIQDTLLSMDLFGNPSPEEEHEAYVKYSRFSLILNVYQEQSYLLDPYLEQLVQPVVGTLKDHVKACVLQPDRVPSSTGIHILTEILYKYIKFRGYKSIIRFFPHEVADLPVVLNYMHLPDGLIESRAHWALRYVLLLWLSLIAMIPFDLVQLDEPGSYGKTASTLEELGKKHLDKAGLERDGAALLLSKLYMRKDTSSRFHDFLNWAIDIFQKPNEGLIIIGILQVAAEVTESGPLDLVKNAQAALMKLISSIDQLDPLARNTLVRKFKAKLLSRFAIRLLPHGPTPGRRKQGKTLEGGIIGSHRVELQEADVPEDIEFVLEQLLESLQDKDTVVRWSVSKGIARIAENLPTDFAVQVLETVMGLFSIHSIAAAAVYDLPAIAEATWHGACLACAEMARRNLIPESHMAELVGWLAKALYFDIRKGAHSIGANVRDAAAYVLWALARTQDIPTLKPHANTLANHLASVAIYDREVHIRRAASAAFQEHVGRTNLFPHGIDVLSKTDFYSVSARKHSFIVAAPQVARHQEYRSSLLHHVLDVVLRHWDATMRELGAQSLRKLCLLDLEKMTSETIPRIILLVESLDATDVHGGLLALTELGIAYRESVKDTAIRDKSLQELLGYLSKTSENLIIAPRNQLVTEAACRLIAITLTKEQVEATAMGPAPLWMKLVDIGMNHRQSSVQEAAAEAAASYSKLENVSSFIIRVIKNLSKGSPHQLQSLAKVLSALDYGNNKELFPEAITCLLDCIKPSPRATIETRRAWLLAIPSICNNIIPGHTDLASADIIETFISELFNGLEDYTIDERGDVGSWVRIASIQGLTSVCSLLIRNAASIPAPEKHLPPARYLSIVTSVMKQGIERLDNVRQEAGKGINQLLRVSSGSDIWNLEEFQLLQELFISDSGEKDWSDAAWLFPRAIKLLDLPPYRQGILSGSINSIGSKTDSTQKEMSKALATYIKDLPLQAQGSAYDQFSFLDDLLLRVSTNVSSNKVVLPIFQTFNVLLEAECLAPLADAEEGLGRLQSLVVLTTKHAGKWKSVPRIHEAMKIFVNLLGLPTLRSKNVHLIREFLAHPFPKVRYETAEYFYLQIESADYGLDDTSDIEAILLETRWSAISIDEARKAVDTIVLLFQEAM